MIPPSHLRILAELRRLCGSAGARVTCDELARACGISRRTVLRALPELERAGMVVREGGRGSAAIFRTSDTPGRLVQPMSHVPAHDCSDLFSDEELEGEERPGREYIQPKDPAAAANALARWCHAIGRGPRWARERGAALAKIVDEPNS